MAAQQRIEWKRASSRLPSDAERAALRSELVEQARAVRRDGWDNHRPKLTAGRIAVLAYLLGDDEVLTELDENEGTVLTRTAADLFGFTAGRKDVAKGLVRTQEWFDATRRALGRA